jgi:hypothetical protein
VSELRPANNYSLQNYDQQTYKQQLLQNLLQNTCQDLQGILHRATSHCYRIEVSGSLFSKLRILGREPGVEETHIGNYTGPTRCGLMFVSSWQVTTQCERSNSSFCNGWHIVSIPIDSFLLKLNETDRSNELQRFYNILKVEIPLLVDSAEVVFGDRKCPFDHFRRNLDTTLRYNVTTFKHPERFGKPLVHEFDATIEHERQRSEATPVFDDIGRLRKDFGENYLRREVSMADIMCMHYRRSSLTTKLAHIWGSYVRNYSMRPQLSFNRAIDEIGIQVGFIDR